MRTLPACAILFCLLAGGCVAPENDRVGIGQSVRLEAFAPQPALVPPSPAEQVMAPSITGVSRANWESTEVLVPVDGTVHYPIYARRTTWADKTARQRNQSPTASNALELYAGSEPEQEYEALNNQFRAVLDVILIIPRMIGWRPWRIRESPDEAYQRYWHPERPEPPIQDGAQSVTP